MRTVAIVQARLSSSRLPGKVLMELGGKPMILFLIDRLRRASALDHVLVATSDDPSDDPLATALAEAGIDHVRASLDDVLERFCVAADHAEATRIVRVTGDCPLIDPAVVDAVVAKLDEGFDYVSNVDPPSFPDGIDVEAFTRAALDSARAAATLKSDREHVTPWLRRDENGLNRANVTAVADLSALRWTVDYADDLALVRSMVDALGASAFKADLFDYLRVFAGLGGPAAAQHERNEGLLKSLREDQATT